MQGPLELLATIDSKPVPCSEGEHCKNSPFNSARPLCMECNLCPVASVNLNFKEHHWKATSSKHKHPIVEAKKRYAKYQKTLERAKKRAAKDPARQARTRAAARAERKTNAAIIKSTRNSGRVNRDGDHVFDGRICLDTKQQSNTENPVVHLHELDKVRRDARNSGYPIGGLVLRGSTGRGVVVFDERDLSALRKGGLDEIR